MIDVRPEQLKIIKDILQKFAPDCEVRVFGSRYKKKAWNYSDLDLAVIGEAKLDWKQIGRIKEEFEESDLPYRVDVLDWHAISPEFQKVIEAGYEVIQERG